MTDRLDEKIRSLMVQVVEASPAAQDLEDIMELRLSKELPPVAPLLTRVDQPRRRWLVAVASAAAVLVVVGGAALLVQVFGSETPVATTPTDFVSSLTWSRASQDEGVFSGEGHTGIGSVTVGGPGLVAVGGDENGGAVWTSEDGATWSRVPFNESVFGGEDVTMVGVTAGGPGLVAVGWQGSSFADGPETNAVVWASVDGITWSRVPHEEEIFGSSMMLSVTAGGPGFVAVGMTGGWPDGDAAIWTSVDGLTWARVPHDEEVFGGVDSQIIHDVTVGGPGLVAVGNDGGQGWWDNNADNHPAVWISADGLDWSRVPDDEAAFGSGGNPVILGVTAGGPGLVAVGADWWPSGEAVTPIWTSPDGISWTRVPDDEGVQGHLTNVAAGGPGLVAVAVDDDQLGAWESVDGINWSRVSVDAEVFGSWPGWITDVAPWGSGYVAVGYDEEGVGAVWVSER